LQAHTDQDQPRRDSLLEQQNTSRTLQHSEFRDPLEPQPECLQKNTATRKEKKKRNGK
jgi:hypothetical protein